MFVKELKQAAAARLRVVAGSASVRSAALAFADRQVGLLVVCGDDDRAIGVVSKSDLVRHMASGGGRRSIISTMMSRPIVACTPDDDLYSAWRLMKARELQNMPVLGARGRPLGVLDIRDAGGALLEAERYQEQLLADYISGIGYQ